MSCEEIENQIPDYHENLLSPVQRLELETHLAECAHCRALAGQLLQLDAELSTAIRIPTLSADFDRRLQERIQNEPSPLPEAERARCKRRIQAEFESGRALLDKTAFSSDAVLQYLLGPVVAIVAGWLVWRLTLPAAARLIPKSFAGFSPTVLPWLAASVVFLAITLPGVLPRRWKSL